MILLIGIVKKNAILMIDFALQAQREDAMEPREAIFHAAVIRFRPIIMTTTAALLGALPLCFSFGEGSELRQPLGISIVGGLIVSQALTLYTTPIVYLYLDRLRLRFSRAATVEQRHLNGRRFASREEILSDVMALEALEQAPCARGAQHRCKSDATGEAVSSTGTRALCSGGAAEPAAAPRLTNSTARAGAIVSAFQSDMTRLLG